MKKKLLIGLIAGVFAISFIGCNKEAANTTEVKEEVIQEEAKTEDTTKDEADTETNDSEKGEIDLESNDECPLEDGLYLAKFITDSSMFHVNETKKDIGELTVKDGKMTIHISLASKGILNLFEGLKEDAEKDGAVLLSPTTDTVNYDDGTSEEVYGYDINVPYLDKEFDIALIGKKGVWYDHKVSVSEPEPVESFETEGDEKTEASNDSENAFNLANVTLTGGTGKSTIESPAELIKDGDTTMIKLIWSSKNYDYMIVDGTKYLNEAASGEQSTFTVPVLAFNEEYTVIGDTTAMSTPHEVEYALLVEPIE